MDSVDLEIRDSGAPVALLFEPRIPLGARLVAANCGGHATPAEPRRFDDDEHVRARITVPSGLSHCHLEFAGGVSLILPPHKVRIGGSSTAAKLTQLTLQDGTLSLSMDVRPARDNFLLMRTPWKVAGIRGASIQASFPGSLYKLRIESPDGRSGKYRPVSVQVTFAEK